MFENFMKLMEAGGPLMYLLTVIGLVVCFLGFYQLSWLMGLSDNPETFKTKRGVHVWANKALEMTSLRRGLEGMNLTDSLELCFGRIEESLSWRIMEIKFCAQISTLVGFLGTVTGMVKVFDTVAKMGKVTPADLAGGIHEALFTTVYGLIIAIIAWFFVHCIELQVRKHIRNLETIIFSELDKSIVHKEAKEQ